MPFDLKLLDGRSYLCDPAALRQIVARVAAHPTCPTAQQLAKERAKGMEAAKQAAATAVRGAKGKVGVIPIYGPVDQRYTAEIEKAGGTPLNWVSASLDALLADASVGAIVLDIDSPGGCTSYVEELADKIYNARGQKPIYSIANSMACSAAFWIATAAGNFSCTPGGDVGSVGVYTCHVDESKALEDEGLSITFVSAGRYKTELAPTAPLSDDARGYLQEQVDATYGKFLSAVARNRGTTVAEVRKSYGQGRVLNADQAKAAGMIDAVRTLEDLLGKLFGGGSGGGGKGATAEVLRARHAWRQKMAGAVT